MELHVTVGVLTENFQVYRRNVEKFAETNYKDVELNNNTLLNYACCDEGHSVLFRNDYFIKPPANTIKFIA